MVGPAWKFRVYAVGLGLGLGVVVATAVLLVLPKRAQGWNAPVLMANMECSRGICRHRPNEVLRIQDATGRLFTVTANRLGFRGPLPPASGEGDDALVVQLYGDSMFHGTGVDDADTLSANVQRRLRDALGDDVWVTNFGMPMNYLVSSLQTYAEWGRAFHPDWVVLQAPSHVPNPYDINARVEQIRESRVLSLIFGYGWGKDLINQIQTVGADQFDEADAIAALQPGFARLLADQRARGTRVAFFSFVSDFRALDRIVPAGLRYLRIGTDLRSQQGYADSAWLIPGDGHPNARGTAHFATFIADAIRRAAPADHAQGEHP